MNTHMLDNADQIIQSDKMQVFTTTKQYAAQCLQAFQQIQTLHLPPDYKDVRQVVIMGMGGSHLGGQVLLSLFGDSATIPIIIKHQYQPPRYVDEQTLVIATSYSGNTVEALEFVKLAIHRKAKIVIVTSGGELAKLAANQNLPSYVFDDNQSNPSKVPRYGSGFLVMAQLAILMRLEIIKDQIDIRGIIKHLEATSPYDLDVEYVNNPAKKLAQDMQHKAVILTAANHLTGSAYNFKNLINESAKHQAVLHTFPELNHHLLESFSHPSQIKVHTLVVFIESPFYSEPIKRRIDITKSIISQMNLAFATITPQGDNPHVQAFDMLKAAQYTALYLAYLNHEDPGPNPWVDELKKQLAQ